VTTEVTKTNQIVFTIPECCRPKHKIEIGMNVWNSVTKEHHLGSLLISPSGQVTDPETPVPVGVWYLLDDMTWNLT